jgi:hypothetical protein
MKLPEAEQQLQNWFWLHFLIVAASAPTSVMMRQFLPEISIILAGIMFYSAIMCGAIVWDLQEGGFR